MNELNSFHGDMPAAFITMSSESVASLLSTCAAAITSAIGAMMRMSWGITRDVMLMKTRTVWPWLVIRSMSRNAVASQITAVRLIRISTNAPRVVRKIYQPIDPIALRVPR